MSFNIEDIAAIEWGDAPWWTLDVTDREFFEHELACEVCDTHALAKKRVTAIARGGTGNDDSVLFFVHSTPPQIAIVHLTFRQTRETSPEWPSTGLYDSVDEVLKDIHNW